MTTLKKMSSHCQQQQAEHKKRNSQSTFVMNKNSPPFVPKARPKVPRERHIPPLRKLSMNPRYRPKSIQTAPCRLSGYSASMPSVLSMGSYPPNTQYIGIAVTAQQLTFLLNRELAQRKKSNANIDKRRSDDRALFTKCEKTLLANIKREQRYLDEKLEAISVDSAEKKEMRQLLDEIVDLDAKTQKAQGGHVKRTLTAAINDNKRLLDEVAMAEQQIAYWNGLNAQFERDNLKTLTGDGG